MHPIPSCVCVCGRSPKEILALSTWERNFPIDSFVESGYPARRRKMPVGLAQYRYTDQIPPEHEEQEEKRTKKKIFCYFLLFLSFLSHPPFCNGSDVSGTDFSSPFSWEFFCRCFQKKGFSS